MEEKQLLSLCIRGRCRKKMALVGRGAGRGRGGARRVPASLQACCRRQQALGEGRCQGPDRRAAVKRLLEALDSGVALSGQ